MSTEQPATRFVVIHSPGPAWVRDVDFREQPGVFAHVAHYQQLFADGGLELGGPFLLANAGGLMLCTPAVSAEQIEAFAAADPAVQSGLLTYEVRQWYVPMDRRSTEPA